MPTPFTERVLPLQPEGAYAVLARAKALEAQGRDIIHLEIGQPDFPTPAHVARAGADAIYAGRTRYTPPAGTADLRAAIAEAAGRQRGLTFRPEEVVVGPGAKPAIFFPTLALVGPGDEVVIPDPGFPSYAATVRVAGGVPVPVRLADMRSPDPDELAAVISPRTRLIILNSPSNPTGGVIPPADLERIAALARRADLWVISDEIYSELVYEGAAPSIAALPGMAERTIIVDGFSKTYAMTGWRLGFGIMPAALAERVELLLTHSVGCTADFTQVAGVAALRGDQGTVAAMQASFRARRDRTVAALNTLPGVRCASAPGRVLRLSRHPRHGPQLEAAGRLLAGRGGGGAAGWIGLRRRGRGVRAHLVCHRVGADRGRGGADACGAGAAGCARKGTMTGPEAPLPLGRVVRTWWPLALSWLLMAAELPVLSVVVARLAQPEINLAAYGGVVFPLALIIEAPILMLLPASTALSKDEASYHKLWRFMMRTSAALTALHVLIAFTPLYYVVVREIIGVPAPVVEPARIGLMIMVPWTWAIAYRRFNQGVLIRFGHPRAITVGTMIRMTADVTVLAVGYLLQAVPGIVVATAAVATGVVVEAIYVGLRVQPVLREQVRNAPPLTPPLTTATFLEFYTPLALTSLLNLLVQPVGSAAISRMPLALESLATWPVVTGLIFILRSLGFAYNEVVVALLDEPGAAATLRRFTAMLVVGVTALLTLLAVTPLSALWFTQVVALAPSLAALARPGLWIGLPIPALSALQSWSQGALVHSRRTRGVTEAVVIYLVTSVAVLVIGVAWARVPGLYVGLAAFMLATATQTAWLSYRSRTARRGVR